MLIDVSDKYLKNDFGFINGKYYSYENVKEQYKLIEMTIESWNIKNKSVIFSFDGSFLSFVCLLVLLDKGFVIALLSTGDVLREKKMEISCCKFEVSIDSNDVVLSKMVKTSESDVLASFMTKNISGLIIFSSGTSGEPKAVLHNWSKLSRHFNSDIEKKRKMLLFLEMDHIGGINTFFSAYHAGSTIVVPSEKKIAEVCSLIGSEKVDVFPTTPSFLNVMYLCNAFDKYDFSSLKIISYGTEKMRANLLTKLSQKLPKVRFLQTYGLSEIGIMRTSSKSSDSLMMKIGGKGFEYKIVNDELYIKSDCAMEGYLNADFPFDSEGWYNTHDIVLVTKHGYIEIVGRYTDIVNIHGLKCNLIDIEEIIAEQFENVEDCLAFTESHSVLDVIVCVKIWSTKISDEQVFKKQFFAVCKKILPTFMVPVKLYFSNEPLNSYRWKKERQSGHS